ncbi:MAG: 30S ribosomal protein S20 [Gemmatimonadota bacterium]
MANTKSAKKRIRQAEKRTARNRSQKSRLKTGIKNVVNAPDAETAEQAFRETSAMLDRYATRNLIHRNKAQRKKSQLAKIVKEKGGTP